MHFCIFFIVLWLTFPLIEKICPTAVIKFSKTFTKQLMDIRYFLTDGSVKTEPGRCRADDIFVF